MSGMGGPDDEAMHAQVLVDNYVELIRQHIPRGESRVRCLDCDEAIPEARREAQKGCLYCIDCQEDHDSLPKVKILHHIL